MWVRTQLKIRTSDLIAGYAASLKGLDRQNELAKAESYFGTTDAIATYSVRSGFDLLLQALDLKPGDEVLFSALNVKGMVKVVREAGLVPVPIDLDVAHMAPQMESFQRAISPRARVLVAAHLMGARLDLDPLFKAARQHGLVTVEDCAQAFNGRNYPGSAAADVSMYSFGPIKTATALGGALLRVRPEALRQRMLTLHETYPVQPESKHRKRMLQFLALKAVTSRPALGAIYRFYRWRGKDYEDALADRVRDVAPLKTKNNLRQQPSAAMLHLMNRQFARFSLNEIAARTEAGNYLRSLLEAHVRLPAIANAHHDYWAFAMLMDNPKDYIAKLRREGFDACTLNRSQHIPAPPGREGLEPIIAAKTMRDMVVLPCYAAMPKAEMKRLADAVIGAAGPAGN
jgi:dTDP-4-amino-4,6-dideoxygalactose transaminase